MKLPRPGKGWSLWMNIFSLKKFDQEIQPNYSQAWYWTHPDNLGTTFHHIDWQISGDYQSTLPISWHIWMTKQVKGWLPISKNMNWWGMWTSALVPQAKILPTLHVALNLADSNFMNTNIWTMEGADLLQQKLSPHAVSFLLRVFSLVIIILNPSLHQWGNMRCNTGNQCLRMINDIWNEIQYWQKVLGKWSMIYGMIPSHDTLYKWSSWGWLLVHS